MIIMIIDVQGPLCQFRDNAILKQKVSIQNISVLFSSIQGTIFMLFLRPVGPVTLRDSEIPCRLRM